MATKQLSNERLNGHIETLANAGNLNAPPGSRPWAIAVRLELQSVLHDAAFNAQQLKAWRDLMKQYAGYRQLIDEHGKAFKSYEELCKAKPPFGLGSDPSDIDRIVKELESAQVKTLEEENFLFKEQGNRSKYLEKFSKLVQACPDQQPINAHKIVKVLRTVLSNAHIWRQRWLDLGWIEPLLGKGRGYYQITEEGRKVVREWLAKVQSATLNGGLWVSIPRHNSKKAAEQIIKTLDVEQIREIYELIGESLNQESISG
ncbi:hypothetical protein [Argonema antarcticum]|uniref:hypothetical protein n=1 Tax=Argonema antarcticum TaxID=2942763 RepID=UPI00201239B7|nr:hypothetical protein [Argonema antarcticum]MCL1470976.1 hypothetical protein [Argonema antarcticum A004/B2]